MLKRVAAAVVSVVTAAVCFALAVALAMLAAEKAAVDLGKSVARASEASGVAPETVVLGGLGVLAMVALMGLGRRDTHPRGGGRYRRGGYSRPARRGRGR